ncbi:hypothetical protein V1477_010421 [Vespula maculifrons]|uniref:Uncharacterized protein n=1 Tax=Vespula maculifrons TaxID=7453 RepID=A0ABD2C8I1_VESMC
MISLSIERSIVFFRFISKFATISLLPLKVAKCNVLHALIATLQYLYDHDKWQDDAFSFTAVNSFVTEVIISANIPLSKSTGFLFSMLVAEIFAPFSNFPSFAMALISAPCSIKYSAIITFFAKCNGVYPLKLGIFTSAPFSTKYSTIGKLTAVCKGKSRVKCNGAFKSSKLSITPLTSVPSSINKIAQYNGLPPPLLLRSAPFLTKNVIISGVPLCFTNKQRGVLPSRSVALISAPFSMRNFITSSEFQFREAQCKSVPPNLRRA